MRYYPWLLLAALCGITGADAAAQAPPSTAVELSPQESEAERADAELRSGFRVSLLRKGKLESEFSPAEKKTITDNCPFGVPKAQTGAGLGRVEVIVRDGYVLGHSAEARIPYWVCEHSTADELDGPGDREKSRFTPEPKLAGKPRSELRDYVGSGYDRGHMQPAANARKSQTMMDETHFLSNIIPQVGPTFNQGIWAQLEKEVRAWTKVRGETWIISGPLFYDPLEETDETADGLVPYFTIGEGDVAVPTHCYKIVLAKNAGGEWESIAFMFDNDRHGKPYRLGMHLTTITWIEQRAGLDFMPDLSGDPAKIAIVNRLKNKKSELWEKE